MRKLIQLECIVTLTFMISIASCKLARQPSESEILALERADEKSACVISGQTYSQEICTDYSKVSACIQDNCVKEIDQVCQKKEGVEFRGGDGFLGNMIGYAKCDQVHDSARHLIDRCLYDHVFTSDVRPCTILYFGWVVNQHIYYGICLKGKVIAWTDPWKHGNCTLYKPNTGYHSDDHKVEEWVQRTQ